MLSPKFKDQLTETLDSIEAQGLYKRERLIAGAQSVEISVVSGGLCCLGASIARSGFVGCVEFLC